MNRFERHIFSQIPVTSNEASVFSLLLSRVRYWMRESQEPRPFVCEMYRALSPDPMTEEKIPWSEDASGLRRWYETRAAVLWCGVDKTPRSLPGVEAYLWPASIGRYFEGRLKRVGFAAFDAEHNAEQDAIDEAEYAKAAQAVHPDDTCSVCGHILMWRGGADYCQVCEDDDGDGIYSDEDPYGDEDENW